MLYIKQFSTMTTVTYLLLIIQLTCVELGLDPHPNPPTPFLGKFQIYEIHTIVNFPKIGLGHTPSRGKQNQSWDPPPPPPTPKKILNPLLIQYYLFRVIKDLRYTPRYNYQKTKTKKPSLAKFVFVLNANILNNQTVQKYFALRSTVIICLLVLQNDHHNYTVK